jgi:hypothetical protein
MKQEMLRHPPAADQGAGFATMIVILHHALR